MGFFDSLTDIFTGNSAKKAAAENKANLEAARTRGTDTLTGAKTESLAALDAARGYYDPLAAKYGKASDLALDALGANGAGGNERAVSAFQASPGYDWSVDQALEGVNRKAAALGIAGSGNTLAALTDRASNLANQEYGSWLDRLQGYVSPEMAATGAQAGYTAVKVPVISNTANSIVGLDQNTVKGVNDQNTQAANAALAGSKNIWDVGLNIAKLGTSLLGGK